MIAGRPWRLLLQVLPMVALAAAALPAQLLPDAPPERCSAMSRSPDARAWLDRAAALVLPSSPEGRVLTYRATHDQPLWEQSDRMYEPFIPNARETVRWYDPASGIEGRQSPAGTRTPGRRAQQAYSSTAAFVGADSGFRPVPGFMPFAAVYARLNPWMVLREWRDGAAAVRVRERCFFRDASRVVLERAGERLYLSEADAMPVKLERIEPHYLWGQLKAEYLWNTWWGVAAAGKVDGFYPLAAFRVMDGVTYDRVGVDFQSPALVVADSAPSVAVPTVAAMNDRLLIASPMPDTLRVGERTFLLTNPVYNEVMTLQADTVFLLDATTSEERARQDSTWISRLFPGRHPVAVVVTDLAWPHISGVRFWVARGGVVYSHADSRDFLQRVINRRWTRSPDALEATRPRATLRGRFFRDSLRLAKGGMVLHALRGTTTEGAIGAWLRSDRFFWAGDYVQGTPTSPYVRDVIRTIRHLGLDPALVGGQHVKPVDWPALREQLRP